MNNLGYLLKGILIGLMFGLPVGAVGTMTVQRSWNYGFHAGLLTGLGSSIADCLYAAVGAFGLTVISDFLMEYQTIITVVGGTFVLWMGIRLLRKDEEVLPKEMESLCYAKMFFSAFTVGITNPAAILTFLFAYTWFGIGDIASHLDGGLLVLGVFIGTYTWWLLLTSVTRIMKQKIGEKKTFRLNKIFGAILVMFGLVIFIRLV
ncbi:MAG: LysE family transporter [Clostridiales bacterium]|nr:LysE family transporter [Clostridiales bacterium]